jgi:hypothetical protein
MLALPAKSVIVLASLVGNVFASRWKIYYTEAYLLRLTYIINR